MTSATEPKTILLKGQPIAKEARLDAGVDIRPGMLLETDSATEVSPHGTATGFAQPIFARENEVIGKGIDDNYAEDGETVLYYYCRPGDEVYALLETGAAVTAGVTYLESAGDGTLQAWTNGVRVAKALETKTASGVTRCKVEVL